MGNKSKTLKWLGKFIGEVLLNAAIQAIIDLAIPDEVGISAEAEDTPAPSATVEHSETTATADTELPDKLDELARLVFEKKFFDYKYDADPPGMKEGGEVRRFAKMCSLADPDEAHAYIRDVIMTEVILPEWMKPAMANDLTNKARSLVNEPLAQTWSYDKYENRFEADDEHQRSIVSNAVLIYVNASASLGNVSANLCIIYFMAVYYDVETQKATYRQDVKKEAYDSAKQLTGATSITNDEDLKRALETYASSQWNNEFGYAYDSSNPKDFEGGEAATLVRNRALKYLQEADDDEITKNRIIRFITDEFFQAINTGKEDVDPDDGNKVKDKGVKGWASDDLLKGVLSAIDGSSSGEWTSRKFDKEYAQPMDPGLNSIRGHVLYYVFQLTKTTDEEEEVTVKYIHCQGVFYEVIPALKVVTKELYVELCMNLKNNIKNYTPSGRAADDPAELRNILLSFGKQEFLKKFGFQWKETLKGEDIPGYKSGMDPRVYNVLFDFTVTDPGRQLIEDRVGLGAFKKDGWEFPWKSEDPDPGYDPIQEVLFNDICDKMELLSKPEGGVPKDGNIWYNLGNTVQYPPFPDKPTSFVKQYFFYVYVLGKKAGRDAKVETLFVYYLSVFCGEPFPELPFKRKLPTRSQRVVCNN